MRPNYNICDKCEINQVEIDNRLCLDNGQDDLGEKRSLIVDLCPECTVRLVHTFVTGTGYRTWAARK